MPLSQQYEERLKLIEAYDHAGFYCYHLAEHHATPLGMAPSPAVFLSAVAQRTKRMRLGPLVYILSLQNPLRAYEDICMLDHLSNGRLELGLGRGVSPVEIGYYGVDPEESRGRYQEAHRCADAGVHLRHASPSRENSFRSRTHRSKSNRCNSRTRRCGRASERRKSIPHAIKNKINMVCNGQSTRCAR